MFTYLFILCRIASLFVGLCVAVVGNKVYGGGLNFHHSSSELFIPEGKVFCIEEFDDCFDDHCIRRGTIRKEGAIEGKLCCDCVTLVDCCTKVSFSGIYNGNTKLVELSDGDYINLDGQPELVKKIVVKGKHVMIEGAPICQVKRPCFIKIEEGASACIGFQSHVPGNICFSGDSCKEGKVILCDAIKFNDDTSFKGHGTVKAQDYPVEFYGEVITLDHCICWYNAKDINLYAKKTELSGQWVFQTTGKINGHGGILDLCDCPDRIIVKAGQTLYITDLKIKCPENIKLECGARVVVSNVELELGKDYILTEGEWVFAGPTTIVTQEHTFGCQDGDGYCAPHITIEDGVTVIVDTMGHPGGGFNCTGSCVVNKGRCTPPNFDFPPNRPGCCNPCQTTIVCSDVVLNGDLCVTDAAPLFVGGDACSNSTTIIRIDGNGFCLSMSNHRDLIKIAHGTTLLLENISLCDFSPCAVQTETFGQEGGDAFVLLPDGSRESQIPITGFSGTTPGQLVLGRGVTVKLAPGSLQGCPADSQCGGILLTFPLSIDFGLGPRYADLPTITVIEGRGYTLNIDDNPIIFNAAGKGTLLFRDIRLLGLHSAGYYNGCSQNSSLIMEDSDGTVIFEDARLYLTGDYTYCKGYVNFCRDNVIETSCQGHSFTHHADRPSTILSNSSLLIAPKVTYRYEYQPDIGQSPLFGLVLQDDTSILKFDGSVLSINTNGFCFSSHGCLFIDNHVIFETDDQVSTMKSIHIPRGLTVEVLAAAVLESRGVLCIVDEC